jgi:hypothetical protein
MEWLVIDGSYRSTLIALLHHNMTPSLSNRNVAELLQDSTDLLAR